MILNAFQFFYESSIRTKSSISQLVARLEIKDKQEQQSDWQHANPKKMIWLYYGEGFLKAPAETREFIAISETLQKRQPLARFVIGPKCKNCCQHT